jgi:hypothetical protein
MSGARSDVATSINVHPAPARNPIWPWAFEGVHLDGDALESGRAGSGAKQRARQQTVRA